MAEATDTERPAPERAGHLTALWPLARERGARSGSLAVIGLCAALLGGCAGRDGPELSGGPEARSALRSYVRAIEPVRLAANRLLDQADPIIAAFHQRRISAARAADLMAKLERQFAAYTVDVAAIEPTTPALRGLHAPYAEPYVLEDAYLSALASGLGEHELTGLPDTQSAQRAAIIRWRTGLAVLARQAKIALPADLQQAGRGEIAPSPTGS